jgi:TolB protein
VVTRRPPVPFTRNPGGGGDLYTMRADGSKVRRRTNLDANTFDATWPPNGKRIAFYSSADGDFEIHTLRLADNHLRQLTHNDTFDGEPDYSPNGKKIVFSITSGIHRMNTDGTNPRPRTDNPNDFAPIYAPDGDRIAFSRVINGTSEVFSMRADGSKRGRLTRNALDDIVTGWQPLRRHRR